MGSHRIRAAGRFDAGGEHETATNNNEETTMRLRPRKHGERSPSLPDPTDAFRLATDAELTASKRAAGYHITLKATPLGRWVATTPNGRRTEVFDRFAGAAAAYPAAVVDVTDLLRGDVPRAEWPAHLVHAPNV